MARHGTALHAAHRTGDWFLMASRAFVIAGPSSGVGKTTVTLGLMAALTRRGLTVQPFKCGPDFIDPGHHGRVCHRTSRNLDGWMLPPDVNRAIFRQHAASADVSIVEGVMGLFDGASRSSNAGSTAAMAALLNLPIVLVVDASQMAASAAALVHGFATFDPTVVLAGVIFNRVGSATHYSLLHEAVARSGNVPSLGYLPQSEALRIPERYLGLVTAGEDVLANDAVAFLADLVEQHIDLDGLLDVAAVVAPDDDDRVAAPGPASPRIGVARDRAFCFYYEDNVDALRRAGAEIVDFSPMHDAELPPSLDGLYFGGGYPELWAEALSANRAMRASVRRFIDAEHPVYAECGGLMYLAENIHERSGRTWPMVGVLPWTVVMTDQLQRFGYVEVTFTRDCLLGPAGTTARGHSFHCSRIDGSTAEIPRVYHLHYTLADRDEAEGFSAGSVLASYIHLHFLSTPTLASAFVRRAARHRETARPVDPVR
jgi:cobyrinic acid a,c-diamide synthase